MLQRIWTFLGWPAAAALSAYALWLAVQHGTPVDLALPGIAVGVVVLAATSHSAVLLAIPALVVVEALVPEERLRLLLLGVVLAAAFGAALVSRRVIGVVVVIVALAILRWPGVEHISVFRELLLFGACVGICWALRNTPLAVAIAVITGLATSMIPLRTFAVALVVLILAVLARFAGLARIRAAIPSAFVVACAMTFFAWSGLVARAPRYFLRRYEPPVKRYVVTLALAPGKSAEFDVPDGAQALIASGANVSRQKRGTLLGTIQPGNIPIRIGDVADWGALRRELAFQAHNPLPRKPAGIIRGYGYDAWLDGGGIVPLPVKARQIVITANPALPETAALQVEAFAMEQR